MSEHPGKDLQRPVSLPLSTNERTATNELFLTSTCAEESAMITALQAEKRFTEAKKYWENIWTHLPGDQEEKFLQKGRYHQRPMHYGDPRTHTQ